MTDTPKSLRGQKAGTTGSEVNLLDEGEPPGSRMMSSKERADLKKGQGEGFVQAQARKFKGSYVPRPDNEQRADQASAQQVYRGAGFAPTIQGAARRKESAAPAAKRRESAAPAAKLTPRGSAGTSGRRFTAVAEAANRKIQAEAAPAAAAPAAAAPAASSGSAAPAARDQPWWTESKEEQESKGKNKLVALSQECWNYWNAMRSGSSNRPRINPRNDTRTDSRFND